MGRPSQHRPPVWGAQSLNRAVVLLLTQPPLRPARPQPAPPFAGLCVGPHARALHRLGSGVPQSGARGSTPRASPAKPTRPSSSLRSALWAFRREVLLQPEDSHPELALHRSPPAPAPLHPALCFVSRHPLPPVPPALLLIFVKAQLQQHQSRQPSRAPHRRLAQRPLSLWSPSAPVLSPVGAATAGPASAHSGKQTAREHRLDSLPCCCCQPWGCDGQGLPRGAAGGLLPHALTVT